MYSFNFIVAKINTIFIYVYVNRKINLTGFHNVLYDLIRSNHSPALQLLLTFFNCLCVRRNAAKHNECSLIETQSYTIVNSDNYHPIKVFVQLLTKSTTK